MKRSTFITAFFLLFVTASAWATEANSCASKSAGMKPSERDAFMKSCLAQVNAAANSKEGEQARKRAACEQNAQNRKLQGNDKANYVASCVNTNEAQTAAQSHGVVAQKSAPAAEKPVRKAAATQAKPAKHKSCAQQAKEKALKGEERKKFMASCK